jgi:ribosomal protein L7/L12
METNVEDQLLRRIAELERRLDWLYVATGHAAGQVGGQAAAVAGSGGMSPAVMALVGQGNKIGAIKQYREETGSDLREARDAIDRLL